MLNFFPSIYLTLAQIFKMKIACGKSLSSSFTLKAHLLSQINPPTRWATFVSLLENMNVICKMAFCDGIFEGRGLNLNCALILHSRSQSLLCGQKEETDALAQREKTFFCLRVGECSCPEIKGVTK